MGGGQGYNRVMVVQLRNLEKALEEYVTQKSLKGWESQIDDYLNENANISSTASSKLHDMLYKMWLNEESLKRSRLNPHTGGKPDHKDESKTDLVPVRTRSYSQGSDSIDFTKVEESLKSTDPRVFFLHALNRLAPCLINKDQLQVWWDELAMYAIDSTGHRLDVANQAKQFIKGVLSGSVYEYCDSSQSELFEQNSMLYGRAALDIYLGIHQLAEADASDERVRFIRLNCRSLFSIFAQRYTNATFSIVDEYFVQPKYRVQLLDLVVEYFSEYQNSKLFRVYETPFFESLLTCLEQDKSRIVIQLAVTALSMVMVHICHKLTTNNLLFRIYGIFGRACSWQPGNSGNGAQQVHLVGDEEYIEELDDHPNPIQIPMQDEHKPETTAVNSTSWEVYNEKEDESGPWVSPGAHQTDTIKVGPLFTFLYGLFPINTLQFCRQCDEYFAKHNYQRLFKDYWSRFMVTGKAERIIRQFRVDPMLVTSNEETELANAVQRFQKLGSALVLSSICMCRRITDLDPASVDSGTGSVNFKKVITSTDDTRAGSPTSDSPSDILGSNGINADVPNSPSPSADGATATESLSADGQSSNSPSADNSDTDRRTTDSTGTSGRMGVEPNEAQQKHLDNHRLAFQMHNEGSAGYWYRELLLMRNELAFANFSRDMCEQRAVRWQKRASNHAVTECKNEELVRQNKILRAKVNGLELETQKAVRSARTMMRERSAYESKILSRNREFREKVGELTTLVEELRKEADNIKEVEKTTRLNATKSMNKVSQLDQQLLSLKNGHEAARQAEATSVSSEEESQVEEYKQQISALKYTIEQLKADNATSLDSIRSETLNIQAELAKALAKSRPSVTPQPVAGKENSSLALKAIAHERNAVISRLRTQNDELSRRCVNLEHELRARKIHEEERLNELQAALSSTRSFTPQDPLMENKFRGRGGAQGVPRRQ